LVAVFWAAWAKEGSAGLLNVLNATNVSALPATAESNRYKKDIFFVSPIRKKM